MYKYKGISLERFTRYLFDHPREARQAAEILAAILRARSARLTEIASQIRGSLDAAYKRLQRFLQSTDPRTILWRLLPD
ncbi:MAG: transposase, partial [Chloroflexi bacterium]|nr:transposase [Chloroflexota bacterium]